MSPDRYVFGEGVLALWHRLSAASSRPARGIAYADSEAEWNPPAGASRDPQGLRERPGCVVGGPLSSTLHSSDALGGWRGRAVEVAVRRRGACNFPGDRGGADRPDVAFGLPSFPAGVSFVGARRCLPRGAGSRWVAAEPRPRRRGSRRILALPTDPRAVVPVESRARRPELPRRRLVLAPRGGSGSAARAWLRLDLVGGLATITPTHPVSSRRCPPHPCPPRPAACRCHPAAAHWLPRPRSAAGLSSPPAPLAVSGRRSPAWLRLVACRPPHPPLCRPPAARPIHVHPIRLRAPAVPLLPAGSLPPPGARRPSHCRRTLRRCLRPAGRLFTPAGTLMLAGSLFPLGEEARNLPGGCSFLPLPGGSLAPPSPPPPRPTAPVRLRLPAGPTAARGLPPCLRIPSSCSPLLSCCVPAGSSVRLSRRPVRLPLRAPRAVCVWRILASGT